MVLTKPRPTRLDVVGGFVIGAFMTTLALVDFSVVSFATSQSPPAMVFLQSYLQWKSTMPILKWLLLAMLPGLPVVLVLEIRSGLLWTFTRRSSPARHAADVLSLATLISILSCILLVTLPSEQHVAGAAAGVDVSSSVTSLSWGYRALVLLQATMMVLPAIKYVQSSDARDDSSAGIAKRFPYESV